MNLLRCNGITTCTNSLGGLVIALSLHPTASSGQSFPKAIGFLSLLLFSQLSNAHMMNESCPAPGVGIRVCKIFHRRSLRRPEHV